MIPRFEYIRVFSLPEAVDVLSRREDAAPLAGGQSLIPMLKLRLASYGVLVDIGRVRELRYLRYGDVVEVGALVRHYELEESPCGFLRGVAVRIGDPQVRSLGTVGGSLAHADPFGDWPAAMLALGAVVKTVWARRRKGGGDRRLRQGALPDCAGEGGACGGAGV
jgi:carbon-monoxide dehydrogenase medium subunit